MLRPQQNIYKQLVSANNTSKRKTNETRSNLYCTRRLYTERKRCSKRKATVSKPSRSFIELNVSLAASVKSGFGILNRSINKSNNSNEEI